MAGKKKNLDAPVTLRDFQEFIEFAVKTFVTKDDLKGFATKDDLKAYATKIDLQYEIEKLKYELIGEMSRWKNEILNSNDKLAKKLDIQATERLMAISAFDRHEVRITRLEKHTGMVK